MPAFMSLVVLSEEAGQLKVMLLLQVSPDSFFLKKCEQDYMDCQVCARLYITRERLKMGDAIFIYFLSYLVTVLFCEFCQGNNPIKSAIVMSKKYSLCGRRCSKLRLWNDLLNCINGLCSSLKKMSY